MTVKEIKQKLDDLGIEYDDKMKKDELANILKEHSEDSSKEKTFVVVYYRWRDLEDNDKIYKKDDIFDHEGKSEERIKELSTRNNKIGKVLIKETD